jgi:branched-chain amino acid transport system substrate-binding protein
LAIAAAVREAGGETADRASLIAALRNLRIATPEDPAGFETYMNPDSHQVQQVIAIGRSAPDDRYPPARMMLHDLRIYYPENLAAPMR